MRMKPKHAGIALAAIAATSLGVVGAADAATSTKSHKSTTRHSTRAAGNSAETELTGDAATQAKAAALEAVPGGTVTRASTEDPSDASGAKYEVHVTKSDGSRVEVLEDAAFAVLSTKADAHGGRGDHGGRGGNPAETELTGDAATQAKAAALAAVPGGTVRRATLEDPSDSSGAKYEVHVTKSDGSEVEVLEDAAFKVIATNASPQGRHGGHRG
jgi:uncharacterized membrane protein YkoI